MLLCRLNTRFSALILIIKLFWSYFICYTVFCLWQAVLASLFLTNLKLWLCNDLSLWLDLTSSLTLIWSISFSDFDLKSSLTQIWSDLSLWLWPNEFSSSDLIYLFLWLWPKEFSDSDLICLFDSDLMSSLTLMWSVPLTRPNEFSTSDLICLSDSDLTSYLTLIVPRRLFIPALQ